MTPPTPHPPPPALSLRRRTVRQWPGSDSWTPHGDGQLPLLVPVSPCQPLMSRLRAHTAHSRLLLTLKTPRQPSHKRDARAGGMGPHSKHGIQSIIKRMAVATHNGTKTGGAAVGKVSHPAPIPTPSSSPGSLSSSALSGDKLAANGSDDQSSDFTRFRPLGSVVTEELLP